MATLNLNDLLFILQQIKMAEANQPPVNPHLAFGIRTVLGINNNVSGLNPDGSLSPTSLLGSADQPFPRVGAEVFIDGLSWTSDGGYGRIDNPYVYTTSNPYHIPGVVFDSAPRTISNLISDQSTSNQAAVDAANAFADQLGAGYVVNPTTPVLGSTGAGVDTKNLFIGNITPDSGLSAPYNTWFTLFGQFFDHGLDLVPKSGTELVFIPLQPGDSLYGKAPGNFMILSRAVGTAGADGVRGTADDTAGTNVITPYIDQSQTYSSHPSHQVFLREYMTGVDGQLHSTGKLLSGANGGQATWADLKANAATLGFLLPDTFVGTVPLLATDDYGNFIPGANGRPQLVVIDTTTGEKSLVPGGTGAMIDGKIDLVDLAAYADKNATVKLVPTGHQFLNDIAHNANPFDDYGHTLTADADGVAGGVNDTMVAGTYDDELLGKHYVAGDGRVNENYGLTAIHEIFHLEHNRQLASIKEMVTQALLSGDTSVASEWLLPGSITGDANTPFDPATLLNGDGVVADQYWNGERLFQAAKFATETQYQHLVFEEFARKISPTIHLFGNVDLHLDPAITAEFAHAVYRFGHSMLDQTLPTTSNPDNGLLQAFLNPVAFSQIQNNVAEVVGGTTHQIGNEIDEFVTGQLRDNLLGLPLDLAALNITRGRETGLPSLNMLRNQIYNDPSLQNAMPGDTTLKPYENWAEFGQFLKHEGSLVNFIAAYGTHSSLLALRQAGVDKTVELRAAATQLISLGLDPLSHLTGASQEAQDAWDFMHGVNAYKHDKNDIRAVHQSVARVDSAGHPVLDATTHQVIYDHPAAQWSTGDVTGVDRIDLWIGGLAEKQTLFGGLLGSTFNFIFETQMENLQDADRLYYLPRIEGLHWGSEIEANSFAEMIINNAPGVKGLPASIFLTPEYVVDVDAVQKLAADKVADYLRNPETHKALVERLADGTVVFLGDDNFLGNTIVMDGTDHGDRITAGQADDDTIWGKGGADTLDGGNGNDFIYGGIGNDSVTDSAGDDNIHGDAGNDIVYGGLGADLVFGGEGSDKLVGGEGIDAIVGGVGDDLIIGNEDDDELEGNEGNDWIEGGIGGDLLIGDQGAPTGQVPLVGGNDVLDGGAGGDRMQGFSGDDIMLGLGGFDKFEGRLGYDWASFEQETNGVSVDMDRKEFIPGVPGGDAVRDVFVETEGVSGTKFDDLLQGSSTNIIDPFNELNNPNLIKGLQAKAEYDADGHLVFPWWSPNTPLLIDPLHAFFAPGQLAFSGGNIMLAGAGSDSIMGRAGNDYIDGDAWLHVDKTWDPVNGLQITREILWADQGHDVDVAIFSGNISNYDINLMPDAFGFITVTQTSLANNQAVNVNANAAGFGEGTDHIRNVERLQFADGVIVVNDFGNRAPDGTPIIQGAPIIGQTVTADISLVRDGDFFGGLITNPFSFQWQWQDPAKGKWVDIAGATGETFTVGAFYEGNPLRVVASYTDTWGYRETVASAATAAITFGANVNTGPVVIPQQALTGIPDTAATQGQPFNYFIPVATIFRDAQTAVGLLKFEGFVVDSRGGTHALDGSTNALGLTFSVIKDATGAVTGAQVTGTMRASGDITIRVKVSDAGPDTPLSTTDDFVIHAKSVANTPNELPAQSAFTPNLEKTTLDYTDLKFVLDQIKMAEANQPPVNPHLAFGLRKVSGIDNNVTPDGHTIGAADQAFPRVGSPVYLDGSSIVLDDTVFDPNPGTAGDKLVLPNYLNVKTDMYGGTTYDTAPRLISNLISDQSTGNQAAVDAANAFAEQLGTGYTQLPATPGLGGGGAGDPGVSSLNTVDSQNLFIGNITPDNGLSAPANTWFTLFGQFFDHGLDLVTKTGKELVYIQLLPGDPLYKVGGHTNFMVLSRAVGTQGADGLLGTSDDNAGTNVVTPFIDQSQTYSSHPSHQVFLREYMLGSDGVLHATGKMLSHLGGGQATWGDLKANAATLGFVLTDKFVGNVPLLATDDYGNFIPGEHGRPQLVLVDSTGKTTLLEGGTPGNLVNLEDYVQTGAAKKLVPTGHQFLNDISHNASPFNDYGMALNPDADTTAGGVNDTMVAGTYDDELLDKHYVAGDGRVNENFGLTAVHEVFHAEHNRQVEAIKQTVRDALARGDSSFASEWVIDNAALADGVIADNEWNGERIFQAAKFATETQYQHLVFEEFARKISPTIHLFGNVDIHLDPAITAEFAHAVYRFGHSMLDQSLPTVSNPNTGLLEAFLNPVAYANMGSGAVAQIAGGTTHQISNEIDEFVTGQLRNNLLGLPLDLAALNIARGRETGIPPLNLLRAQIFDATHDTNLKPYANWAEFGQFLKHEGSLVNFVAAYGTHKSLLAIDQTSPTATAQLRAAALDLITKGLDVAHQKDAGYADAWDFMHSQGAYANDKANPMAVHVSVGTADATGQVTYTSQPAEWSTGSVTGLDRVDLWIGGLAEKQNLFGGLLGSTFNFIFETQMENLQDADRLYYLPRVEGLHWGSEIEANSFADIIMRNFPDARGLSASIFLTPEYTVDVQKLNAWVDAHGTAKGFMTNHDTGADLVEVMTDGTVHFVGDDNFLGNTIVIDGTDNGEKILSGQADDDTVWGRGGNDTLDGNNGNDFVYGGLGNDLITDTAGADNLHGDAGSDTILAGIGDDLVFGGDGSDSLDGGDGIDAIVGGLGNDLIFGGEDDDELEGNQGDDWIEGGLGGDLLVGDQGAPTGQVPLSSGNDVLVGNGGGDRMQGFSGDDIMLGVGGFDKFEGRLGYDWASFELESKGVDVDMERKEFIPAVPGGDAVRDVFLETEGVSGTRFDDRLSGTIDSRIDPFNELDNPNLINGLQAFTDSTGKLNGFFAAGPVAFSGGNIMLGGAGSDTIIGRGGNDYIDGDAYLEVSYTFTQPNGLEIFREIKWAAAGNDVDVAVYSGLHSDYLITGPDDLGFYTVQQVSINGTPIVAAAANGVQQGDGTDHIRNIERIQFSDITIAIGGDDAMPAGLPLVLGDTDAATVGVDPRVGQTLTADISGLSDGDFTDGVIIAPHFQWQWQDPARGAWVNIVGGTNADFTPGAYYEGQPLRVEVSWVDPKGFTEMVFSAATNPVAGAPGNTAPIIIPQQALTGIPDTAATQGQMFDLWIPLTKIFRDAQTPATDLVYKAFIAGQVLDGSPEAMGLTFELTHDAVTGAVDGGRIFGVIPQAGPLTVTMKVTDLDAVPLSVLDDFVIDVQVPVNHAPVTGVDTYVTFEDTALEASDFSFDLGVLANDTDPDGDPMTAVLVSTTQHGQLVLNEDGSFLYTPDENWSGIDTFTYKASDGTLTSGDTVVAITVRALNDAPVNVIATPVYKTTEAASVTISGLSITDVDVGTDAPYTMTLTVAHGALAISAAALAALGGSVTVDGDGTATLVLTGAMADINTLLAADAVSFVPVANEPGLGPITTVNGDRVAHVDLTITVDDGGNTGLWGPMTDTDTATIDVKLVNDGAATLTLAVRDANGTLGRDQVGSTITATLGNDPDGNDPAAVIHWFRDGQMIRDRFNNPITGSTYTLTNADLNRNITADVTYTDGQTFQEHVVSNVIGPVGVLFNGRNGDDRFAATNSDDALYGVNGDDWLSGLAGNDYIVGGVGADTLLGGTGLDTLIGAAGSDSLDGGTGADSMVGGTGNDTYVVDIVGDVIVEDANAGTDTVRTNLLVYTLGANLENLTFTGSGGFNGIGNELGNTIIGGNGNDTLDGGLGRDSLVGGAGNDVFLNVEAGDSVQGGSGTDRAETTANAVVLTNQISIEVLTFVGTGNFTAIGTEAAETITGAGGADRIDGGIGADSLIGNDGNDTLLGGQGADVLSGGAGDDSLDGGAGDDRLIGGLGSDTFNVGAGDDVISFSKSAGGTAIVRTETVFNFDANPFAGQDFIEISKTEFGNDIASWVTIAAPIANGANAGDVVIRVDADHSGTLNAGDVQIVLKASGTAFTGTNQVTANDIHFV